MCAGRETKKNLKIWDDASNVATRHTSQNRKHRKCFPTKPSCKIRGELEECRKKKADIPLVGCLAYDTENLFTAGIDNSSEEIRKVTGIIGAAGIWVCLWVCVFEHKGGKRKKKKRKKRRRKPISRVGLSIHQCLSANRSVWKGGSSLNEQSGDWVQGCCGVGGVNNGRKKCADLNVTDRNTSPFSSSLTTTGCWSHSMCWCNVVFTNAVTLQTGKNKTEKKKLSRQVK